MPINQVARPDNPITEIKSLRQELELLKREAVTELWDSELGEHDHSDEYSGGVLPVSSITPHDLLSDQHDDTVPTAVTQGDLVYGNATPAWTALSIGTAQQILAVNGAGTAPAWISFDWDSLAAANRITMVDGGTIGQAAGPLITFDDTNNYLEITGCNVGLGVTVPLARAHLDKAGAFSTSSTQAGQDSMHLNDPSGTPGDGAYGPSIGFSRVGSAAGGNYRGAAIAVVQTSADADTLGWAFFTHPSTAAADPIVEAGRFTHDGKFGIGTTTIPHGGVGAAMFAMDGADSSAAGPHVQFTTATDNYPLLQIVNWTHDNVGLIFDAYHDGAWKSSDAGSNFKIHKVTDLLVFGYDSGVAQGGAVTWNNGLVMATDGNVMIGSGGGWGADKRLIVIDSAVGDVTMLVVNDANDASASGIGIICGNDAGSGITYYIVGRDGDGDEVGGLRNNSGTFQVYDSSDEATKTNIERTTRSGLDVIRQVEIYDFNRVKNPNGPRLTGTIAQNDLKLDIPGMVAPMRDGKLATSHSALIPFLVKAIQEQQEAIERLIPLIN